MCICCATSLALLLANLSFINLSDILISTNQQKYCGLTKDSLLIDVLTASILPIGKYRMRRELFLINVLVDMAIRSIPEIS